MKKPVFWFVLILLIGGIAVGYFVLHDDSNAKHELSESPGKTISEPQPSRKPISDEPVSPEISDSAAGNHAGNDEYAQTEENTDVQENAEIDEELQTMFQVADNREDLVLDENTRLNIEQLTALNTPDDLNKKLHRLSSVLPTAAHNQLVQLTKAYNGYILAVKANYPPDVEVNTVEEAREDMEGLHNLRVQYFGADVAEALFGKEERMNQKLLELMSLEADENLTMEERAHKAQLLLQEDPEFAEIYDPERN